MNALSFPFYTFRNQRRDNLIDCPFRSYFEAARRCFSYERISAGAHSISEWAQELRTMEHFLAAEAQKQKEAENIAKADLAIIDSG